MVNLFNQMDSSKFRHAVISLTDHGDMRTRIVAQEVAFYDLGKKPGHDYSWMPRLARLFRELRPAIVHSRNLNALEAQFVAAWCKVPGRVHGEHGRDMSDLAGRNWKYQTLRRLARSVVHEYIAVSEDLAQWLRTDVGVAPSRVHHIYNGVDHVRYCPVSPTDAVTAAPHPGLANANFVVGSVGRMAEVKNYPSLVRAFCALCDQAEDAEGLRLLLVGDGVSRSACAEIAGQAGRSHQVVFAGEQMDTAPWLRAMDVFVLPSWGEGISNTILEAQASGLPCVVTAVGGNPELVTEGLTGALFTPDDVQGLTTLLGAYRDDARRRSQEGRAARARIEARFSWPRAASEYQQIYSDLLAR